MVVWMKRPGCWWMEKEITVGIAHELLDTLLVERKIENSLVRAGILNASPIVSIEKKRKDVEKAKKEEESRQVEEIRMLDDIPNEPLASLENCSLDEIIYILQNHASDPIVNSKQASFGSFIANHIIKENLDMYHKEYSPTEAWVCMGTKDLYHCR
jgi:hypothetical protein